MAVWKAKPGIDKPAHAVADERSSKALCGAKVSKKAMRVVTRFTKCEACKKAVKKR